jgi:hypothetical protein
MVQDDFLKIIGIISVSMFVIYMLLQLFHPSASIKEGLTNKSNASESAENYAAGIKAEVVKMQDQLLISKYRKDYENAILNLDDYFGYLMLQQVMNMKPSSEPKTNMENINALNAIKNARDSLDVAMKFLDAQ